MAKDVQKVISVRPAFQVNRGAVKCESCNTVKYVAQAIYDTSLNDSAGVSNKTVAAHGLGVFIPAKAIITNATFQTVTGFTSAGSTATVALKAEAANDLFSALAVSDSKLSATGFVAGVPVGTAATWVQTTVERELIASVAVQALTAGKLILFVEYVIGL